MNFMEEQYVQNNVDKSKKSRTILLVLIILVIIAIIIVVGFMIFLEKQKLIVNLNGQNNDELKRILRFEEDGAIHIPIKDISAILGYKCYNGNYFNRSEDEKECYSEIDEEVVSFFVGEKKIEKINKDTQQITYFYLDEPVEMIDGKLYTTQDGIEKAFNLNFEYDKDNNKITLSTMQYLNESYQKAVIEYGFKDVSTEFEDQKAILNNFVIVKNDKNQYGIFDISNDKEILETKYSQIKYIPISGDFLVKNNNKIGIFTNKGQEKIKMQYDSIELINQDLNYYVVKKDGKFGVINENESVIIPMNCDKIGIDTNNFLKNNLKNKYIILDKMIPVMKNNLWGLYDLKGDMLCDYSYDSLGCTSSSTRNTDNVLVVEDYNVIIGCKNKKYYLINQYGEELANGLYFDEVYMIVDLDEVNYYVVKDEKRYNLIEFLKGIRERLSVNGNSSNSSKENNGEKNNSNENNSQKNNSNENNGNENNDDENNDNENNGDENNDNENNDDENNGDENNGDENNDE